jgi:hypothetical protein
MSEERRRLSYLLRLWQAEQGGVGVWRASLQSAHTGERRGFASLAELYVYLEQATAAANERKPSSPRGDDVDAWNPKRVLERGESFE